MSEVRAEGPPRVWRHPTTGGPRRVLIDGCVFEIPEDADVRIVHGSGGIQFGYVRSAGRVVVLSRYGELERPESDAARDAKPTEWASIGTPAE